MSQIATGESTAEFSVTPFILRLRAHIKLESKECILTPGTLCIEKSFMLKLDYFYKASTEIVTILDLVVHRYVRLSSIIKLRSGEINTLDLVRSLKARQRDFFLKMKHISELFLSTLDLYLLLSRKKGLRQ